MKFEELISVYFALSISISHDLEFGTKKITLARKKVVSWALLDQGMGPKLPRLSLVFEEPRGFESTISVECPFSNKFTHFRAEQPVPCDFFGCQAKPPPPSQNPIGNDIDIQHVTIHWNVSTVSNTVSQDCLIFHVFLLLFNLGLPQITPRRVANI